ncbi:[4Fe-4S] proteins maturation [Tulasnella sp. 424]|nr:[4Fe-4S] proteins maturation [Tulasnella sp. 424]KAG8975220.1 [4Fe-4S] proteins maturation [Tulasnella sp. 425]
MNSIRRAIITSSRRGYSTAIAGPSRLPTTSTCAGALTLLRASPHPAWHSTSPRPAYSKIGTAAPTSRFASTSTSSPLPEDSVPRSTLVSAPTKEELEQEEVDVDWDLLKDPSIRITERAAEQLRNIAMRDKDPDVALRVAVESGGCHGYQYKIELTSVKDSSSEL